MGPIRSMCSPRSRQVSDGLGPGYGKRGARLGLRPPPTAVLGPSRRSFLLAAGCAVGSLVCGCRQAARAAQSSPGGTLRAAAFRAPGLDDRQVLTRAFAAWA